MGSLAARPWAAPSRHLGGPATCSPALLVRPLRSSPAAAWAPWRGHRPAYSKFPGGFATRPPALSVFRQLATGSAALLVCLPAQLLCCRPGPRVHLGQLVLQSLRHGRGLCSALLRGGGEEEKAALTTPQPAPRRVYYGPITYLPTFCGLAPYDARRQAIAARIAGKVSSARSNKTLK